MLSIFKKLFAKSPPKAVYAAPRRAQPSEPTVPIPLVEVAHLSLSVIVNSLSEEMKVLIRQAPAETATVALPVPTIMKQLPTGCVKISLASLHRQAHGVFVPLVAGDKRTVDVPLAEIFRHVSPRSLKRRADQRIFDLPENGFNLFGNAANPYEIAPTDEDEQPPADSTVLDLTPDVPGSLKLQGGGPGSRVPEKRTGGTLGALPAPKPVSPGGINPMRVVAPPSNLVAVANSKPPLEPGIPPKNDGPPVTLSLSAVAEAWPEEVRSHLEEACNSEASLAVPMSLLSQAVAKGRVVFTWGQVCGWIEPEPVALGDIDENTSLAIPLKIAAPAFLAASKQTRATRKSVRFDESIPALFSGGDLPPPRHISVPGPELPAMEAPLLEAERAPDAPHVESDTSDQSDHTANAHGLDTIHLADSPVSPEPEAAPALELQLHDPAPAPHHAKLPETVGEAFGDPHKFDWTPSEIVQSTVKLPGVSGAVVALQEGLQVASSLPDGVKSDVVAAFLPQIFARLNQYAGEMKLGEVDDLLFTTHGAHCQIYRLGFVYFAVLGRPGESLPWHELRLISEELARQTNK